MAEIDVAKERINYLKVWLGIFVVTTIGLLGWLVSHYETLSTFKLSLSILSFFALIAVIHFMNKKIMQQINDLRDM